MPPKAPPRLPRPAPLPAARRVFAHVRAFDVACPACGAVHVVTGAGRPGTVIRHKRARDQRRTQGGYDQLTGVLTCRGCRRPWVVGLVLWRVEARTPLTRPADHTPTPGEAEGLRDALGGGWGKDPEAEGGRKGYRATGTNLVCWCGADCPAHPKGDEDVID